MPAKRRAEYGLITARLIVDLIRTVGVALLLSDDPASSADLVMLCAALFVGQAEGRPMTASKIAAYIGMPRPTVIRKLRLLHMRGIVAQSAKNGWRVATERSEIAARVDVAIDAHKRHLQRACDELSKLDTAAIAGRKRRT